jgi:hypothetical protein
MGSPNLSPRLGILPFKKSANFAEKWGFGAKSGQNSGKSGTNVYLLVNGRIF